ncbi:MAG: TetR/AcrR family transcriptional regulator [Geminicoccaceae bacterium]
MLKASANGPSLLFDGNEQIEPVTLMSEATKTKKNSWRQDPDGVKADILATATEIFATHGLSGARVDEIARRTQTSKRMIYYYFGDKDGLYMSVLEAAYAAVRSGEDALNLDELDPISALCRLVEFTFDYHRDNRHYVRLVQIENIHDATHLQRSERIPKLNLSVIEKLKRICRKGIDEGVFRSDISAVELHWLITSSCFFNVSNRATFERLYGSDSFTSDGQYALKKLISDAVLGAVLIRQSDGTEPTLA